MSPIIITGVGRRAGFAMAEHLLNQGYSVIGSYRHNYPRLAELSRAGASLYQLDLSIASERQQWLEHLLNSHPSIRALIHNASAWLPDAPQIHDCSVLQAMLYIHVEVPYHLSTALTPALQHHANTHLQSSDIIHISDYVARTGSAKHMAYSASKAAMENLNLSLAKKLAPLVSVNCIAPALLKFKPDDAHAYQQRAIAKNLLGKEGGWQELLNSVDYLLDSQFTTGRCLHLDGGRHLA